MQRTGPLSDAAVMRQDRGVQNDLSEAATMQFIRGHTSIPVPKVYCAFRRRDRRYIVMEKISGMPFGSGCRGDRGRSCSARLGG